VGDEQAPAEAKPKRGLARPILAGTLVVVTSLSIVVATVTTWAHRTVFKTDEWVSIVGPLPRDPDVAHAMAQFAMTKIGEVTDLRTGIQEALPPELAPLTDVVLDRIRPRIQALLEQFIASDRFNQVWVAVNERAHAAIVAILRGESNRLEIGENGQVRLNLVPVVYRALTFLQEHASFALRGHTVPTGVDPVTDPQAAVQALSTEFGRPLPSDFAQPVVFTSASLVSAQSAVHAFDVLFILALLLPLILIVVGIVLAKNRRRRTLQLAVGALLALVFGQVLIRRIEKSVVEGVRGEGYQHAVRDVFVAVVHGLNVLFVLCVVVAVVAAIVAYLLGRPAWLMRLVAACRRGLASERSVRAQTSVSAHASEWMWGGVAVAVLVWWIVGLSWLSFGVVGLLLIGWLVLVESVRRRHPAPSAEPAPAPESEPESTTHPA
jgi:hypothetical protein